MPDRSLADRIEQIARAGSLLVACDYDGTLSPIVVNPSEARPLRETLVALSGLASLPSTSVAVISGRALGELSAMLNDPPRMMLVGSHGSEFDPDFASSLTEEAKALRGRLLERLSELALADRGFTIEEKPASIAFHFRNAEERAARRALEAIDEGPALWEGVYVKRGKKVVELTVVATNKGEALQRIRQRVGASAAVFIGDDVTDEDAFATLTGPDVGIKVGEGESKAPYRVEHPDDVARLLAHLYEQRLEWTRGAGATPIERHSMLSDQRTAALVDGNGKIVWLCLPRLDSPALFAELVGGADGGSFAITPMDDDRAPKQRYRGSSMVLQTKWQQVSVTDFMDGSRGNFDQRAGRTDLIRIVEGTGKVRIEFSPRIDFGREPTCLAVRDGGIIVTGTHDPIVLRTSGVHWRVENRSNHQTAVAEAELRADEPLVLCLCYGTGSLRQDARSAMDRLRATVRTWHAWTQRLQIPDINPELVKRSALTLKALCHGPTGAIAAAATTSLPEHIGGVRNWDYRYCWLRDGAMSALALTRLGSEEEAMRFLDWLLDVLTRSAPERLHPVYTVAGEALGPEAELSELPGYAGSRPVRIGNAASRQVQLDVFGAIMELIYELILRDAPLSSDHWRLVDAMVQAVERRWEEPDHGIWEVRRPQRHHVHSKVMCWLTVDRAVRAADRFLDRHRDDWAALRDRIANDVLSHGYKKSVKAFTAAYEGEDLDAAALWVGISGLVGADDPRFAGTVEAVEHHLRVGPTVYRYRHVDDGIAGPEGGFHICAAWLVDAYVLQGRLDDARELFESMAALAGPTGLLSEEYDPERGEALGNHPQAYSHLAIIENALRIEGALKRMTDAGAERMNGRGRRIRRSADQHRA